VSPPGAEGVLRAEAMCNLQPQTGVRTLVVGLALVRASTEMAALVRASTEMAGNRCANAWGYGTLDGSYAPRSMY